MVIGGGSVVEIKLETTNSTVILNQGDAWVKVHIDDIPELIAFLRKYKSCFSIYTKTSDRNACLYGSFENE